jgi:23S rRNA (pseudouridine1915-N3)-methyltransferase
VKLTVAWIGKTKDRAIQELTDKYLQRLSHYADVEGISLKDETRLMKSEGHERAAKHVLVTLDSRGDQLSSEGLAEFLRGHQDRGSAHLLFAIGAADGFSDQIQKAADFRLSLGKMTLPHGLARVILLEQLYRAFTILKGHPYHVGH